MRTYMNTNQRNVHQLFHILWTKAVGTETYNKNEWKQLGAYLYALMDYPGASGKISNTDMVIKPPTRFEREPVL